MTYPGPDSPWTYRAWIAAGYGIALVGIGFTIAAWIQRPGWTALLITALFLPFCLAMGTAIVGITANKKEVSNGQPPRD